MAEKKTFKQAMGQEKMNKKKAVYLLSAGLAGLVILVVIFLALSSGDDETAAPTTVSTPMVPTNLRYYDPLQEETYETGVNYVILNQSDGSRIRVSDDGRVVEVDERGNIVREIENGDEYISTVTGLMENDSQVALAMDGLKADIEEEDEASGFELWYQEFMNYVAQRGYDYNEVMSRLYEQGYSPDRLYELYQKGIPWQQIIDEVMEEDENVEPSVTVEPEPDPQPGAVTFENTESETSSTSELPSWLQPIDVNSSMNALVDSLVAASNATTTGTTGSTTTWEQQNRQSEKQAWLDEQQSVEFSYDGLLTTWDLAQGSVIPLTLVTGLNTDMPGEIVGLVRQNIYDTLTGTNIVIPKGSRVIASYDSSVAFAQERVAIAWNRLITPDGYVYTLPGFLGVDGEGYSGNEDKHSNHIWSMIGGAMLASIIDLGTNSSASLIDNYSTYYPVMSPLGQVMLAGANATGDVADQYVEKLINRQPTIWIRPGAQITMLVTENINFKR